MEKNEQELAFPGTDAGGFVSTGMTLRDWFAGQAIMGLAPEMATGDKENCRHIAFIAYEVADAMMEAREKCT